MIVTYDYGKIRERFTKDELESRTTRSIWRYKELLPVDKKEHMLEVGDGGTPLIDATRLAKQSGIRKLYLKDESRNLTWSFKDRLACVGVGKALDFGANITTCVSTGNHGAAVAAHSALAGLDCVVFTVPYIPETMLVLMMMYGAKVVPIELSADQFGNYPYFLMKKCVDEKGWFPLSTYVRPPACNPYAVEGYKTIGYEICEQTGWNPPDTVIFPTGHGEGIAGTWMAFKEMFDFDFISIKPNMVGVQPSAASPLVEAIDRNLENSPSVEGRPTIQFSIGVSSTGLGGIKAVQESGGAALGIDDESVLKAQRELARLEGIFVEQSSASSIAAIPMLIERGLIDRDSEVTCILTSGGLKDPKTAGRDLPRVNSIPNDWQSFESYMEQVYKFKI